MRRADGQPQSGLSARHRRVTDGGNENTLFAQSSRSLDCLRLAAEHQRNDGAANRREDKAGGNEAVLDLVNPSPKLVAAQFAFIRLDELNRCCGRGDGGRNRRCGKNKTARPVDQVIN